jgi:hypothetical protein
MTLVSNIHGRKSHAASLAFALLLGALVMAFPVRGEAAVGQNYILSNDPAVSCGMLRGSNGAIVARQIFVYSPQMYSVSHITGGAVSFQPVLWEYDGSRWVRILDGNEVKGGPGMFGLPEYVSAFTVNRAGYFAVSLVLRWYSITGSKSDEQHVWSGDNYQRYQVFSNGQVQALPSGQGYCYMA